VDNETRLGASPRAERWKLGEHQRGLPKRIKIHLLLRVLSVANCNKPSITPLCSDSEARYGRMRRRKERRESLQRTSDLLPGTCIGDPLDQLAQHREDIVGIGDERECRKW
jgi:hypothetical protein